MHKLTSLETIGILLLVTACLGWLVYRDTRPQKKQESREITVASSATAESAIIQYGSQLAGTFEKGSISYVNTSKTMETPLVAYVVVFTSDDPVFQSAPNATTDKAAYLSNRSVALVWQTAFCKPELKELMQRQRVNIVTGTINNTRGDTQFLASCTPD